MVMHARKLPRLNDGYYDRHDYHEEKNDRFHARSNSYDRMSHDRRTRDEYEPINNRQNSPRYGHKPPYVDRMRADKDHHKYNREKGRYPREEYRYSSVEKHSSASGSDSSRTTNSDSKYSETNSETVSDIKPTNDKGYNRAMDNSKTSSEKSNSGQTKEYRGESQKVALRVCGDWSEHVSSSGKKYFYNCKTEVSQWVKPKEWKTADEQVKQANVRIISSASSSNTSTNTSATHTNMSQYNGSSTNRSTSLGSPANRSNHTKSNNHSQDSDQNNRTESTKTNRVERNCTRQSNDNTSDLLNDKPRRNSRDSNGVHSQHLHDLHSSSSLTSSTPSPSGSRGTSSPTSCVKTSKAHARQNKQLVNGTNDGSGEDMDISPDGSPKPHSESSRASIPASHSKGVVGMAGHLDCSSLQRPGPQSTNSEQSVIWGKALQTLQTLQEVLERTRGNSGNTGNSASAATHASESPLSAASRSPRIIPHSAIPTQTERELDEVTRREQSPSVSETSLSAQPMLSAMADAGMCTSVLSPTFINYYDASMITHISEWPAEQLELRAHQAYKDGMIICGHHCSQVSTELKRDRSQVRIAEIQSTLIEHRIMFLKQQISELETQDKSYISSQT